MYSTCLIKDNSTTGHPDQFHPLVNSEIQSVNAEMVRKVIDTSGYAVLQVSADACELLCLRHSLLPPAEDLDHTLIPTKFNNLDSSNRVVHGVKEGFEATGISIKHESTSWNLD